MGGIPYTAHGAQIPPLIFDFCLFFVFMLILGYVKVMFAPQGLELEEKKNKGDGVICAPRAQHGRVLIFIMNSK